MKKVLKLEAPDMGSNTRRVYIHAVPVADWDVFKGIAESNGLTEYQLVTIAVRELNEAYNRHSAPRKKRAKAGSGG